MVMEANGFEVADLGVDVSPTEFVDAVKRLQPQVVAMSALLTTTMSGMQQTIRALREAGLREKVVVMVGGAPVTREFAEEIGADGYGADAAEGVRQARALLQ
jgi:5-methyltetrahydrofolate--homocysteine methyltransferase